MYSFIAGARFLVVWSRLINSVCFCLWGEKQANAIGRSAKTVREFLEKNYTDEAIAGDNEAIKLAIKALLEVRLHHLCCCSVFLKSDCGMPEPKSTGV